MTPLLLTLALAAHIAPVFTSQLEERRAVADDPVAISYGLTPASIASLPLPTTTITAASAAQTFIQNNWGHVTGKSEYISFVKDPFASSGSNVLRVSYPNGTYANSPYGDGGMGMYLDPFGTAVDGKVKRALFTYEIALSKDFDFVQGGKFPGLFGGRVGEHCSGGLYNDKCFSLRVVWRKAGDAEVYAYIPGYSGFDTKTHIQPNTNGYGYSINRGSWKFETGKWQKLSILAIMNSAPSGSPSKPTKANGQISIYLDDRHVFTHTYFVLSTNATLDISSIFFSTFFGGSTEPYASKGGYAYFREMKSYYGLEASNAAGSLVTAVYP